MFVAGWATGQRSGWGAYSGDGSLQIRRRDKRVLHGGLLGGGEVSDNHHVLDEALAARSSRVARLATSFLQSAIVSASRSISRCSKSGTPGEAML